MDGQFSVPAEWVDETLLSGPAEDVCLELDRPITRAELRRLVAERQSTLADRGLRAGGCVALRLPPSLAYIVNLLAGWRAGAQVILLDHRLTQHEIDRALERLLPQVVVQPDRPLSGALRGYSDITEAVTTYPGQPAQSPHAVIQLSSGSTGPSKVIGRTAADLVHEVERYIPIEGVPEPGERVVLLASVVHVLGLVGGLLYGLHRGVRLVIPERPTPDAVYAAIESHHSPATILGVPFHIELLASAVSPPKLPALKRMTTGGELIRAQVWDKFQNLYDVPLGNMYGMTEVGMIGTDLFGRNRPAIMPAGLVVREVDGELQIKTEASPYVGLVDPTRWSEGWLRTKDAGRVDPETGLVTILGRNDSQVSVGGLKVDLTEVEHTLAALPGVTAAVVVFDNGIEAYVLMDPSGSTSDIQAGLAERLAAYKRPRALHVVDQLPRTATGKLVRDKAALRGTVSG